jgi:hypothetical protein
VLVADLVLELRARPTDPWAKLSVDPQAATSTVIAAWRRGDSRACGLAG